MDEVVGYESVDRVAVVTIRRPEKLNALNNAVIDGLRTAWERYRDSDDLCAVLTGEGTRAFSVGADLVDPPTEMWEGVPGVGVELEKPVIAAVSGHCVGGAYILVQHCDLAVATQSARFSYPEARLGLSGGMVAGAVVRMPAKIAMELMLLGGPIDAQRAGAVGIVNRVVEDGSHIDAAMTWARQLAGSAPLVVSMLKRFVQDTLPVNPAEGHAITRRVLVAVDRSQDRDEGVSAFVAKRPARFRGL
jgi:enoyl-CoA hydratase